MIEMYLGLKDVFYYWGSEDIHLHVKGILKNGETISARREARFIINMPVKKDISIVRQIRQNMLVFLIDQVDPKALIFLRKNLVEQVVVEILSKPC